MYPSLSRFLFENVEEILDVIKDSKDEHVEVEQVEEEPVLAAESIEGQSFLKSQRSSSWQPRTDSQISQANSTLPSRLLYM